MKETSQTIHVTPETSHQAGEKDLLSPDIALVMFTWLTFLTLLAVLYKYAWKPILAGLDAREENIRRSVEEAEKTHAEYEKIEETRSQIISEADRQSKEIIAQSRKGAQNAAKVIEQKARDEAQIILENTQREIKTEREKVQAQLRRESADMAVLLATKLLQENLSEEKGRQLVNKLIEKV
jgi:F-type H+-transporting ATPase subunit b